MIVTCNCIVTMKTKVVRIGNSRGIRIFGRLFEEPRSFVIYSVVPTVAAVAAVSALWGSGLTGNWKCTVKTARGEVERAFVFKQEGNKLIGHIVSPRGQKEVIRSGKVEGDQVQFTVKRMQPGGGSGMVTYKGTIRGDKIYGSYVGLGGHTVEWVARRDNPSR